MDDGHLKSIVLCLKIMVMRNSKKVLFFFLFSLVACLLVLFLKGNAIYGSMMYILPFIWCFYFVICFKTKWYEVHLLTRGISRFELFIAGTVYSHIPIVLLFMFVPLKFLIYPNEESFKTVALLTALLSVDYIFFAVLAFCFCLIKSIFLLPAVIVMMVFFGYQMAMNELPIRIYFALPFVIDNVSGKIMKVYTMSGGALHFVEMIMLILAVIYAFTVIYQEKDVA